MVLNCFMCKIPVFFPPVHQLALNTNRSCKLAERLLGFESMSLIYGNALKNSELQVSVKGQTSIQKHQVISFPPSDILENLIPFSVNDVSDIGAREIFNEVYSC